jgi:putative glutamine amidotransferase
MAPRIAVPIPHSTDHEYAERAIPQYERAVTLVGGVPVRLPLNRSSLEIRRLIADCDGVLLPGSKADVNPARFNQQTSPESAPADLGREEIDDLLLEDAYKNGKPVLGICYGLQSLNVFRGGSLVQHIPDFLPAATRTKVNHEAGRNIPIAHTIEVEQDSVLEKIVSADDRHPRSAVRTPLALPVNSSHHQSAHAIGQDLRIVARCPDDRIIEAVEGVSPEHFVLAVQWHPERSVEDDEPSRAIFRAVIDACR